MSKNIILELRSTKTQVALRKSSNLSKLAKNTHVLPFPNQISNFLSGPLSPLCSDPRTFWIEREAVCMIILIIITIIMIGTNSKVSGYLFNQSINSLLLNNSIYYRHNKNIEICSIQIWLSVYDVFL
jgi:hypothetical protein